MSLSSALLFVLYLYYCATVCLLLSAQERNRYALQVIMASVAIGLKGGSTPQSKTENGDSDSSSEEPTPSVTKNSSSKEFELQSAVGTSRNCASRLLRGVELALRRLASAPKKRRPCLAHSSCFVLTSDNVVRRVVYNVVHSSAFEGFIIIMIFMNCLVLALDDPASDAEPQYQVGLNILFTAVFSAEMCLKMIAMGVVLHDGAYFRSGWNALDCVIVLLSLLQYVPGFSNFTAFRTLRVLRPLRSMNAIPQLKTIATCLIESVKGLANVFVLALFIYVVFSILAVQLWMGNMRYRCAHYDGTVEESLLCTQSSGGSVVGSACPEGMTCIDAANPNHGYTSFDSVLWALLTVFQTVTLEGWADLMYKAMDSCGWPAAMFFVLVVILGSYFVLNLCLAVISFQFQVVKAKLVQREIELAQKEEMELRESELGLERARMSLRLQNDAGNADGITVLDAETHTLRSTRSSVHKVIDPRQCTTLHEGERSQLARQLPQSCAGSIIQVVMRDSVFVPGDPLAPIFGRWDFLIFRVYRLRWFMYELTEGDLFRDHIEAVADLIADKLDLLGRADESVELRESVVKSPITVFAKIVYVCILANTIILAASHFQESPTQTAVSEVLTRIFTSVFVLELALKNVGLSPWWYWRDASNVFDGCVTLLSVVDGSFPAFRAFRILRLLRLLRSVPSLQQLIEVFGLALRECGYLFVIFALYFLMAALIGAQLFGDALQRHGLDDAPTRTSFASFPKAFFAVMQINTYDDWPTNMWNAMHATSTGALIYFIVCIFVGNLCVLNLLIAILIDSFDQNAKRNVNRSSLLDGVDEMASVAVTILHVQPQHGATQRHSAYHAAAELDESGSPVRPQAAHDEESVSSQEDAPRCPACGDPIVIPFAPISKSIRPVTPKELHDRVCLLIQRRKVKERLINELLDDLRSSAEQSLGSHSPVRPFCALPLDDTKSLWQPDDDETLVETEMQCAAVDKLTAVLEKAHANGLLLNVNEHDEKVLTLESVRKMLHREFDLLQLKCGEEQVGRALLASTRANIPQEVQTNGGYSLFIFGPQNKLRKLVTSVVTWKGFDYAVLVCIFVSSVLLAIDNPRNNAELTQQLAVAGQVLTVVFAFEMLVKWIAFGFYFCPGAYLSDPWHWLDFSVVTISVVSWILEAVYSGAGLNSLKVLRTLRVLRPLRLVNHNNGLKMVVLTLLQSVKGIANISLILLLVFIIFAIVGVQLFGGILYSCSDPSVGHRVNCTGAFNVSVLTQRLVEVNQTATFANGTLSGSWTLANVSVLVNETVLAEREWRNGEFHFDNTASAFVSLFHVATLDNWGGMMYDVIAGVDYDTGPREWNNIAYGLYFVAFIFIGSMFLMNTFIGLIIENFQAAKAQLDGVGLLTYDQKLWVETQRMMLTFRPQRLNRAGNAKIQRSFAAVAEAPWFELLAAALVVLNVLVISTEHFGQPDSMTDVQQQLSIVFTALFAGEAFVKMVAYGAGYFKDGWNRFDFFIVMLGIFDAVSSGLLPIDVGIVRKLRVFRITRIMARVRKARDIRVLLETLWFSIPSLANIGAFMFLILFVFTVLGVQLWGQVLQDGVGLTRHMNFEDFGTAFLFLIQVTTLDNWGATMSSLQVVEGCDAAASADGEDHCGSQMAPLYFILFILLSSYVMVNLFCAIILDNFDTTMELDRSELKMSDLKRFGEVWAQFDPEATMVMSTQFLPNLLAVLKPPLGMERKTDRYVLLKMSRGYVIPEHQGKIHFVETLIPLARRVLGVTFTDTEIREHEELWRSQFPDLGNLPVVRYRQKRVTVDQYFAATYIAGAFRRRRAMALVAAMRREKYEELRRWYDSHSISMNERIALFRMDKEEQERAAHTLEENKLIDTIALRGNGLDEDDDPLALQKSPLVQSFGPVVGLFGIRATDHDRMEESPPQRSGSHRDLRRRPSMERIVVAPQSDAVLL